jgi:hypothetical protein
MVWLFAAVVLCLAVMVPGFRKVVLIGGAIVIVLIVLFVLAPNGSKAPDVTPPATSAPLQPPAPPKLIPPDQVEAADLRSNFYGKTVSAITARIYNNSEQDTLESATFRLTVDDCERSGGTKKRASPCATVHDETGTFYLEVPPKQARDVSISLKPEWPQVSILGSPQTRLLITEARAKAGK